MAGPPRAASAALAATAHRRITPFLLSAPMSAEDDGLLLELTASSIHPHGGGGPVSPRSVPLPNSPLAAAPAAPYDHPARCVEAPTRAAQADAQLLREILDTPEQLGRPSTPVVSAAVRHSSFPVDTQPTLGLLRRSPVNATPSPREDGFDADFDTDGAADSDAEEEEHDDLERQDSRSWPSDPPPGLASRYRNQRQPKRSHSVAQLLTLSLPAMAALRDSAATRSLQSAFIKVREHLTAGTDSSPSSHRPANRRRSSRAHQAELTPQSFITFSLLLVCVAVWAQVLYQSATLAVSWATRKSLSPTEQIFAVTGESVHDKINRLQKEHTLHPHTFHVANHEPPQEVAGENTDIQHVKSLLANLSNFHGQAGGGHDRPDRIAFERFFAYPKPLYNGVYVEVGATDGVSSSNTLFYEEFLEWRGLLIEGATPNFQLLNERRGEHSMRVHSAVCLEQGESTFIGNGGTAGDVRFLSQHHIDKWSHYWKSEWIDPYKVPCFPLTDLLHAAELQMIDFMSIDVEGGELEAIKSLKWRDFIVRSLVIEGSADKEIESHLEREAGMCLAFSVSQNDYYVSRMDPDLKHHCLH